MLVSTGVVLFWLRIAKRLDPLAGQTLALVRPRAVLAANRPRSLHRRQLRPAPRGLCTRGSTYRHEPWGEVIVYESLRFAIFYTLFSAVHFGAAFLPRVSAERVRAQRHEAQLREAQLAQLTQQLQPHFLFNALNTVSSLIHTDPQLADTLLTRLPPCCAPRPMPGSGRSRRSPTS